MHRRAGDRGRRSRRRLEVADVVRAHAGALGRLGSAQRRVLTDIARCRTADLGGHLETCDTCGHQEPRYNSCRNRHCPKCATVAELEWVERERRALLPVVYFHLVFTIPDLLHELFLQHPRLAYNLLFHAVAETLQEVAADARHLGARIGLLCALHTWTRTLLYHPHVHCVVPGGGLAPDGNRWVEARRGFFLPVRVLSAVFRGKMLSGLEAAWKAGRFPKAPADTERRLCRAARKKWVVYSKPSFAGPEQVIRYLGRYVHRIAISNDRLVSMDGDRVTFRYKDRARGDRVTSMTLPAAEFLRRFLVHVLPTSFVRIRHYGLLANSVRSRLLARCRELLGVTADASPSAAGSPTAAALLLRAGGIDVLLCPRCKRGRLVPAAQLPPSPSPWQLPGRATSP